MTLLNPAVKKTHFSAFLDFGTLKRVGGIFFSSFFLKNNEIQTLLYGIVDISYHFDT